MDRDFWLDRWKLEQIRFHRLAANPLLVAHFSVLDLSPGACVFVPLCGKSLDIGWLRDRGLRVAGAEFSPLAVEQLFDSLSEAPEITAHGPLRRFRSRDIDIFQGDIFDLTPGLLGPVDAIYDRAALIALPPDLRRRYAAHLVPLTRAAPQLLLGLTGMRDPNRGPPFQVAEPEIRALYGAQYRITHLADAPDNDRTGGIDQVWWLDQSGSAGHGD